MACMCQCGHCQVMETSRECVCCKEIPKVVDKILTSDLEQGCITKHEGFEPVCLNTWVLQAAYFEYRQRYGTGDTSSIPENE